MSNREVNDIYKDAKLPFSVTAKIPPNSRELIRFSTQDKGSARLVFEMKDKNNKPYNLTGVTGEVTLIMEDGSRFVDNAIILNITNGEIEYVLTDEQIRHAGKGKGELSLKLPGQSTIAGFRFEFIIERALKDRDLEPVEEYYFSDFEVIKEKLEGLEAGVDGLTVTQVNNAKKDTQGVVHPNLDSRVKAEVGRLETKQGEFTNQLVDERMLLKENGIGIPLSFLGCKPNDPNYSTSNTMLIRNAIQEGKPLFVDGTYYIGSIGFVNTNITLLGNSVTSKIMLKGDLFKIGDSVRSIYVKGIEFVGEDGLKILFQNETNKNIKLNNFSVTNSVFKGSLSLGRFYGLTTTNPSIVEYGIKRITITDNKCENLTSSFLYVIDLPFDFVDLNNNVIRNFNYVIFNFGNTNEHSFGKELQERQVSVKYDHNVVICDKDWWGPPGDTYYCALLCESKSVIFTNNQTEGIKALGEIATYDGYLSSDYVLYENNIWKNNVAFHTNMLRNNTLMKAKGGTGTTVYRNNTFIVERDFPASVGQSEELVCVNLYQMTSPANWVVENNTIDVIRLRLMTSSNTFKDLAFKNNKIKAKYINDTLVFASPSTFPTHYSNSVVIDSNEIYADEPDPKINSTMKLVQSYETSLSLHTNIIVISNNTIKTPDMTQVIQNLVADKAVITNNKIYRKLHLVNTSITFLFYSKFNNLVSDGNIIVANDTVITPQRNRLEGGMYDSHIKCYGKHNTSSTHNFMLQQKPETPNGLIQIHVSSQGTAGATDFLAVAKITTNDSGQKVITFKATDDKEYSSVLNDGTNTNKNIKLEGVNKGGYRLVFYNPSGDVLIYLASNDTEKFFEVRTQFVPL